jgi:hypothetical protein
MSSSYVQNGEEETRGDGTMLASWVKETRRENLAMTEVLQQNVEDG